jgi:type II secretory pathway component PulJ
LRRAFTLAEVLAALAFMAIVIPVAVEGLQVANRAGLLSQRKLVAARLAERVLNEAIVTGMWRDAAQPEEIQADGQTVKVTIKAETWVEESVYLVTAEAVYTVQGEEFQLNLATLVNDTEE